MDTEGPCYDPNRKELLKNWQEVDIAMSKLFSLNFRNKFKDSFNGTIKFGWFFLNWTGFKENPRRRDLGYHKIRDYYLKKYSKEMLDFKDEQCWHYHHPHKSKIANQWGFDWKTSNEYENIISRQIIDRNWFPVSFRAGGTIMHKQLSEWVDQWFPIDFSNRSPIKCPEMDWSDGIMSWKPYKPSKINFKKKGFSKRYLARSVDLNSRVYKIQDKDIYQAFNEVRDNELSVISVFDHDYRDIENSIINFLKRFVEISKEYKNIKWEFSTPQNVFKSLNKNYKIEVKTKLNSNIFNIYTSLEIYQNQPWVCAKLKNGEIVNLTKKIKKISNKKWSINLEKNKDLFKIIAVALTDRNFTPYITKHFF